MIMDTIRTEEPYVFFYYGIPYIRLYNYYDNLIILIFLIVGVCMSLPALVWALRVLYTHLKNGGRISAFIILLLINDLAELLLSIAIIMLSSLFVIDNSTMFPSAGKHLKGFFGLCHSCRYGICLINGTGCLVIFLWTTFRIGGVYLHQLVALESVLSLKSQLCSAHVFTPSCSTILCVILWLLGFGCQFLGKLIILILCLLPCCILAVTCILTCKVSPAPDHIKTGSSVLIISTLTLIASCATVILMFVIVSQISYEYVEISVFLVSLRVISDPLLCVMVCKERVRVHTRRTHPELNADQRSV